MNHALRYEGQQQRFELYEQQSGAMKHRHLRDGMRDNAYSNHIGRLCASEVSHHWRERINMFFENGDI